jgi:SAM-dependent methyltransferase
MRRQRPPHLCLAVDATAEKLPFADQQFDASMATFSVHQWNDLQAGLGEMRRVTRGPVIILTCDPNDVQRFWLNNYAPEVLATEARRYPSMASIREVLGTAIDVRPVPIPLNCRDGFNEAYYGRPEMLLDPRARQSCSAWSFVPQHLSREYVGRLHMALDRGDWDAQYGALRTQPEFIGSLYLIVSAPI